MGIGLVTGLGGQRGVLEGGATNHVRTVRVLGAGEETLNKNGIKARAGTEKWASQVLTPLYYHCCLTRPKPWDLVEEAKTNASLEVLLSRGVLPPQGPRRDIPTRSPLETKKVAVIDTGKMPEGTAMVLG